jgi:hypothetical protein
MALPRYSTSGAHGTPRYGVTALQSAERGPLELDMRQNAPVHNPSFVLR